MHLLASLTVLLALLLWQRVRSLSVLAWLPLLVLQLVAFGLKEDGIMLSGVIVALTILRSWTVGDVRLPSPWVVLFGIALTLGLPLLRLHLLGQLGGYGVPPAVVAWWFYRRGLYGVFLLTPGRLSYGDHQWQTLARYWSTSTLAVGGLLCLASRQSKVRYLFLAGIVVALLSSTFRLRSSPMLTGCIW